MRFIVERLALQQMIEQLKIERKVKGAQQRIMQLSACAARVFVEANGVTAGIEALVLEDGRATASAVKILLAALRSILTAPPAAVVCL